jgi:hypothetical protein
MCVVTQKCLHLSAAPVQDSVQQQAAVAETEGGILSWRNEVIKGTCKHFHDGNRCSYVLSCQLVYSYSCLFPMSGNHIGFWCHLLKTHGSHPVMVKHTTLHHRSQSASSAEFSTEYRPPGGRRVSNPSREQVSMLAMVLAGHSQHPLSLTPCKVKDHISTWKAEWK